jgi:hypothetical protein
VLFLIEWRAAREELRLRHNERTGHSLEFAGAVRALSHQIKLGFAGLGANMRGLEGTVSRLEGRIHADPDGQQARHEEIEAVEVVEKASTGRGLEEILWRRRDEDSLPPLPKGLDNLGALIAGSAFDLLKHDALHVEASDFSPKEIFQIEAELARARAIDEAARGRNRALVAEAMESLRGRGEFIDYRPGEEYQVLPGIITAAENTPTGDTRMYYFLPGEFPDVYELAACRREEPRLALRRIMGIIEAKTGAR